MNLKHITSWRPWGYVGEAYRIPFLHGRVWDVPWNSNSFYAVVPLNICIRVVRSSWEIVKFPAELWWERDPTREHKDETR